MFCQVNVWKKLKLKTFLKISIKTKRSVKIKPSFHARVFYGSFFLYGSGSRLQKIQTEAVVVLLLRWHEFTLPECLVSRRFLDIYFVYGVLNNVCSSRESFFQFWTNFLRCDFLFFLWNQLRIILCNAFSTEMVL